jgi:hypothetical protein
MVSATARGLTSRRRRQKWIKTCCTGRPVCHVRFTPESRRILQRRERSKPPFGCSSRRRQPRLELDHGVCRSGPVCASPTIGVSSMDDKGGAPGQTAPVEQRVAAIEAAFEARRMEPQPFIETMTHTGEEEWVPRNAQGLPPGWSTVGGQALVPERSLPDTAAFGGTCSVVCSGRDLLKMTPSRPGRWQRIALQQ